MGLFRSKSKQDSLKPKRPYYICTNVNPIGQIPSGARVTLTLDSEQELLYITFKSINISLPYSRIISFPYKIVTTDNTNSVLKGAHDYLQSAEATPVGLDLLGTKKLVTGLVGNVASNLIPRKLTVHTVTFLYYIDKNGQQQYLKFCTSRDTDYIINSEENIKMYLDQNAVNFSAKIAIIASRNKANITEL